MKLEQTKPEVPITISVRTKGFERPIQRWMMEHRRVRLSELLRDALKKELAPFARKRDIEVFR